MDVVKKDEGAAGVTGRMRGRLGWQEDVEAVGVMGEDVGAAGVMGGGCGGGWGDGRMRGWLG